MAEHCADCGSRVYNGHCTNCHEEIYIEQQYIDLGERVPEGIASKATEQTYSPSQTIENQSDNGYKKE
jgi:hypothetical protein